MRLLGNGGHINVALNINTFGYISVLSLLQVQSARVESISYFLQSENLIFRSAKLISIFIYQNKRKELRLTFKVI